MTLKPRVFPFSSIIVGAALLSLLAGCFPQSAEFEVKPTPIELTSKKAQKRLNEIDQRIEALRFSLQYQQQMEERYLTHEDMVGQHRAMQRIQEINQELDKLMHQRQELIDHATTH